MRYIVNVAIPSQNDTEREHWSVKHRRSQKVESWLRSLMCPAEALDEPRKRSVHVISYRRRRCSDIANLIGGAKGHIDALTRCKLLWDDSDEWAAITYEQQTLRGSPVRSYGKGQPCTLFIVEDIQ